MIRLGHRTLTARAAGVRYQSSGSSDSYQFMQQSKLPTFHFQRSLPRLPIPLLERTCTRFLAAAQPILTLEEHAHAVTATAHFREGMGAELHTLLQQEDKTNKHTSYISAPWFDMYLRDRSPLPLNYNPLLVFNSEPRPGYQTPLLRAANLVVSSLRFWRSLRAGTLEPEVYHLDARKSDTDQFRRWMRFMPSPVATYAAYVFKAFPLDMSQYERLFGTARIPQPGKDRLTQHREARHILVMRRGHLYAVDVLDTYGNLLPATELLARLKGVLELDKARPQPAAHPLGVLTGTDRDTWASARQRLELLSPRNRQLLDQQVDTALFCLALDSEEDPVYNATKPEPLFKHFLASDGHNRWFDKSVSLLVSADGNAAVNFEHSWGDGVAVLRYFNEVYKETSERPLLHPDSLETTAANVSAIRSLDFELDDAELQAIITQAQKHNASTLERLNMDMLKSNALSKQRCKTARVSPDAMMQLGFQVAYKRAFDSYVGTYESCSTAAFRHGRTETMRPCTMATKEFCESLMKPNQANNVAELRGMLERCSSLHGQLTKDAAMGQGFDRHLFALRELANRRGMPQHAVYETVAYKKLNYNIISTSTLASKALMAGAFGPVVPDGLGVGYSILDDECGAIVTSYAGQRDGKRFIDQLEGAFEDISRVLDVKKEDASK